MHDCVESLQECNVRYWGGGGGGGGGGGAHIMLMHA